MEEPDRPSADEEMVKNMMEADIEQMKRVVEDATVEEVETPTGRKDVEIAWEDEDGFHSKEGEAIGVYRERRTVYHIDWSDGTFTTVSSDELVDLEEGDWK